MGIFLGHNLFLEARSFPQAFLWENCLLLGTDNIYQVLNFLSVFPSLEASEFTENTSDKWNIPWYTMRALHS